MKQALFLLKNANLAISIVVLTGFGLATESRAEASDSSFGSNYYLSVQGGLASFSKGDWTRVNGPDGNEATQYPINQPQEHTKLGYMGAIALGYQFADWPVRTELAYNYFTDNKSHWTNILSTPGQFTQVGDSKIQSQALLLNAYYQFNSDSVWTPYITAGIGYGLNSAQFSYRTTDNRSTDHDLHTSDKKNTTNFIWQAGIGVNYEVSYNFSIGAQLSYYALGDANVNYEVSGVNYPYAKATSLNATVGTLNLVYNFS